LLRVTDRVRVRFRVRDKVRDTVKVKDRDRQSEPNLLKTT